jgi:uncharacterized protein YkuJ
MNADILDSSLKEKFRRLTFLSERSRLMKRKMIPHFLILLFLGTFLSGCAGVGVGIKEGQLISQKPPFRLPLASELRLVDSFGHPGENSKTRGYIYAKERDRQIEEMLILQIADRTNPEAGPITVPSLKPYGEENMYLKDKIVRGEVEGAYLIQIMVWNPKASLLRAIVEKGFMIPSHLALQGQFQFIYQKEHAVSIRYSRDVNSFGLKVSEEREKWVKDSISGSEKQAYEIFKDSFLKMMNLGSP